MSITIASFDIGKNNFAFCVEKIDITKPCNSVDDIVRCGELILHKNVDLTTDCPKVKWLHPSIYINMNNLLLEYKKYWDECAFIIIEQQKRQNYMACRLAQHCYSFFLYHYSTFKTVIEYGAKHKTRVFGAPVFKKKNDRKKWAVQKTLEIMDMRKDTCTIQRIKSSKKKDDLSDVVVQLQAFKIQNKESIWILNKS